MENNRNIRIAGFGGQGVVLSGYIVGKAAALYGGQHAAFSQSYGPEARGGACCGMVVVSENAIGYPLVNDADYLVALSKAAFLKYSDKVTSGATVFVDEDLVKEATVDNEVTFGIPATRIAKEMGVATQMGTQIHAGDNYRRVVEIIQADGIGKVSEVHVWVGKSWSGGERPASGTPVPGHLDWDLWLGPAPERPYHERIYCPGNWRRWWDFGGGTLGDMGCHYMDLPFWALNLRWPTSAEAKGPPVHPETTPKDLIVKYTFAPRGTMPAVDFTWYDTSKRPPHIKEYGLPQWGDGVLFVGTKGMMVANYSTYQLYPPRRSCWETSRTVPASGSSGTGRR